MPLPLACLLATVNLARLQTSRSAHHFSCTDSVVVQQGQLCLHCCLSTFEAADVAVSESVPVCCISIEKDNACPLHSIQLVNGAHVLQDPSTYPLTCELQTPIDSTDPTSFMAMQCTPGYYGPACSLCLRNSTHAYGRTGTLSCQHCRSKGFIVLAYIASTLAVLLLLCYTIHVTLKENSEGVEQTNQSAKASELLRVRPISAQRLLKTIKIHAR